MSSNVIDAHNYALETRIEVLERQIALLLADKNIHVYDDKPKKQPITDSHDDKPKKKRTSGYILYSNATRDDVKEALTFDGVKPKSPDIIKQLAKNWKTLCHREQEFWKAKAKENNDTED